MRGCKQSVSCTVANHQRDSTLPLCRAQKESCGAQSGTRSQGISPASPARAFMSVSIASVSTLVGSERVVVFASLSIRTSRCFHVSSRSSPLPSLALRMGSNDQCDGNQCCPSFGGSPRRHHQEWSLRLNLPLHGKDSPCSDTVRIDRLTALSRFHGWCRVSVLSW